MRNEEFGCFNLNFSFANYLKYYFIFMFIDRDSMEIISRTSFLSLLAIFGFLFLEIVLLTYLPGQWSNFNSVRYKLNGFQCFISTLIISLLLWPWLGWLYQNSIWLILTLEWVAFILCIAIYWKDGVKWSIYDFFAGNRMSS